jgi:hypothetical protein
MTIEEEDTVNMDDLVLIKLLKEKKCPGLGPQNCYLWNVSGVYLFVQGPLS